MSSTNEERDGGKKPELRLSREHVGLTGRLNHASLPEAPAPAEGDTPRAAGEPAGAGVVDPQHLEADAMDEALASTDLSVGEAVERFHEIPVGGKPRRRRKKREP